MKLPLAWFTPALALAFHIPKTDASVVWTSAQWFSWTPTIDPWIATGSASGQQLALTVSGMNAINTGSGTSIFDIQQNGIYSMVTPKLGLGAPKAGNTVTYTLDLSTLTIPSSEIVIGISNLDAVNSRGSITVSALDDLNQVSNVNGWITEAKFKEQAGLPSAQSLVTRSTLGSSMMLGTAQGLDNTSWGDSRGIFFTGLSSELKTITLSHTYTHPNASVSDSIGFYVGIVPEPSSVLAALTGFVFFTLRRHRETETHS